MVVGLLKSKAFYLGGGVGLAGWFLWRRKDLNSDGNDLVARLSKTERLAGMDWKPPSRSMLINRLKGYDDEGQKKDPKHEFDMVIIGGGATGTGCALDAASRGLKVACVEKGDFSCGITHEWS